MLLNTDSFSAILQALGLAQGLSKPVGSTLGFAMGSSSNSNGPNNSYPLSPMYLDVQPQAAAQTVVQDGTSCQFYPYNITDTAVQAFPPFEQAIANIYRYRQQQTVNLGSWFVHEQWMTPSVFACASGSKISELDIASGWGSTDNARAVLEHHWDTFINQSDFEFLSGIGINTVRLPIGYWSLGPQYCQDTPFSAVADVYSNSWSRVVRAINMAGEAGIGVLVDLHGAVGSQNGQPHSGISDGQTNLFNDPANMDKTIDVLRFLVQQLGSVSNVVGIQILNEPQDVPELPDFYTRAISSLRPAVPNFPLYIHDGFNLDQFGAYVGNRTDFVVQDHHSYFVYTQSDESEPADDHTSDVKGPVADALNKTRSSARGNLVVDEWSCALTPQSLASQTDPDNSRRNFCIGQLDVYTNTTAGWGFWSYMKEDCDSDLGWCFKAAVGNSLPSTFFSYARESCTDPMRMQYLITSVESIELPAITDVLVDAQQLSPSAIKGYSDGFLTAKLFALYDMSKLGFETQYIHDSMDVLQLIPGTEEDYTNSFMRGLQDAQSAIIGVVTQPY